MCVVVLVRLFSVTSLRVVFCSLFLRVSSSRPGNNLQQRIDCNCCYA